MLHQKHYTLNEARKMLLIILPGLKRIVELKRQLDERGYDIYRHAYFGGVGPNGTGKFPPEMEELVTIVKDFAVKGIQIKDINIGLVDFPHIRNNGEEVYLCYLLGETSIQYWHAIDGGFSGRLSTDNL